MADPLAPKVWLVWSNEHQAWWRAGDHGYTIKVHEAGRYTLEDAIERCQNVDEMGRPEEVVVPAPDLVRDPEAIVLRLCESSRLALRPNQLYYFVVDTHCEKCVKAAEPYAG